MARRDVAGTPALTIQRSGSLYLLSRDRVAWLIDLADGRLRGPRLLGAFLAHLHVVEPWVKVEQDALPPLVRIQALAIARLPRVDAPDLPPLYFWGGESELDP